MPIYMSFPGVRGGVLHGKYVQWMEVLSVQYSQQPGVAKESTSEPAKGSTENVHVVRSRALSTADLTVNMEMGPEAALLAALESRGHHADPVIIDFLKSPQGERYLRIVLRDVLISSYMQWKSTVIVGLNYARLIAYYTTPATSGSPGSTTPVATGGGPSTKGP